MFAIFAGYIYCYRRLSTFWCVQSNLWAAMNHVLRTALHSLPNFHLQMGATTTTGYPQVLLGTSGYVWVLLGR